MLIHWSILLLMFNTTILIPLQSPSPGFKFLNKMAGQLTKLYDRHGAFYLPQTVFTLLSIWTLHLVLAEL